MSRRHYPIDMVALITQRPSIRPQQAGRVSRGGLAEALRVDRNAISTLVTLGMPSTLDPSGQRVFDLDACREWLRERGGVERVLALAESGATAEWLTGDAAD